VSSPPPLVPPLPPLPRCLPASPCRRRRRQSTCASPFLRRTSTVRRCTQRARAGLGGAARCAAAGQGAARTTGAPSPSRATASSSAMSTDHREARRSHRRASYEYRSRRRRRRRWRGRRRGGARLTTRGRSAPRPPRIGARAPICTEGRRASTRPLTSGRWAELGPRRLLLRQLTQSVSPRDTVASRPLRKCEHLLQLHRHVGQRERQRRGPRLEQRLRLRLQLRLHERQRQQRGQRLETPRSCSSPSRCREPPYAGAGQPQPKCTGCAWHRGRVQRLPRHLRC
jgi:hypothetical protein